MSWLVRLKDESVNPSGTGTGHFTTWIHTVKINLMQSVLPTGFMLGFLIPSFRNAKPFYQAWTLTAPSLCHCQTVAQGGVDPYNEVTKVHVWLQLLSHALSVGPDSPLDIAGALFPEDWQNAFLPVCLTQHTLTSTTTCPFRWQGNGECVPQQLNVCWEIR